MVSNRRRAPADSEVRQRLIEAAEDIIREQGHGALTSRTLAERLSLKRQILHYYFESMDELLVLMVRSNLEKTLAALDEAARSDDPLQAIWRLSNDPQWAILSLELAALAARNPAVCEEVRKNAVTLRDRQTRILSDHLAARGLAPSIDPRFAVFIITSMSQTLAQEELIGITDGHDTVLRIVNEALETYARLGASPYFPDRSQGVQAGD